jgi:hypothetical protein
MEKSLEELTPEDKIIELQRITNDSSKILESKEGIHPHFFFIYDGGNVIASVSINPNKIKYFDKYYIGVVSLLAGKYKEKFSEDWPLQFK